MAKFSDTKAYFKALSEQNLAIAHVDGTSKKFFTMQIEEFLSSTRFKLPTPEEGPALVLIKYIRSINHKDRPMDERQIMFFVLQGIRTGDEESVDLAEDNCEDVVDQILTRMSEDSKNGHSFFQHSFDKINDVRIAPAYINANMKYIGWQVSLKSPLQFNCSYNSANWS